MKNLKKCLLCIMASLSLSCTANVFAEGTTTTISIDEPVFKVNAEDAVIKNKYLEISGSLSEKMSEAICCTITDENGNLADVLQAESDENGEFAFKSTFDKTNIIGRYTVSVSAKTAQNIASAGVVYDGINSSADITSFSIDGTVGTISGNSITVAFTVKTDLRSVAAKFEASPNATVYVGGVMQKSTETKNNFTSAVEYTVISEDKTASKKYTVTCTMPVDNNKPSYSGGGGGGVGYTSGIPTETPQITPEPIKSGGAFNDVPKEHWACDYINKLHNRNIVDGNEEKLFKPNNNITREEFVKMLVKAFDLKAKNSEPLAFGDVSDNAWYAEYIKAAFDNGVVNGIGESTFGVGQNITRADMAVMVFRCSNYTSADEMGELFADDSQIADYARDAVYTMKQNGIINGKENNEFAPRALATRSEAAKIICVLMEE